MNEVGLMIYVALQYKAYIYSIYCTCQIWQIIL